MPSGPVPGDRRFVTVHVFVSTTAIALSPLTATTAREPSGAAVRPASLRVRAVLAEARACAKPPPAGRIG